MLIDWVSVAQHLKSDVFFYLCILIHLTFILAYPTGQIGSLSNSHLLGQFPKRSFVLFFKIIYILSLLGPML